MKVHVAPASALDIADLLGERKLPVPRVVYRHLIVQCAASAAWAFRSGEAQGPVLALAGLYAWGDRPSEAWLAARPEPGASFAGLVLAIRKVLRSELPHHPAGIGAHVLRGNDAGERLVAALGFGLTDTVRGGRWGVWRLGA